MQTALSSKEKKEKENEIQHQPVFTSSVLYYFCTNWGENVDQYVQPYLN